MKYNHLLVAALIGTSIVAIQAPFALALSPREVNQIAKEITVRIINSSNLSKGGSGVIIKRSNNTYTLLTAYHVFSK
jgi:hypothetical protein